MITFIVVQLILSTVGLNINIPVFFNVAKKKKLACNTEKHTGRPAWV